MNYTVAASFSRAAMLIVGLSAVSLENTVNTPTKIEQSTSVAKPQPADLFDFWVGDWDLTWTTAKGDKLSGKNHIVKILGNVIEENFEASGPASPPPLKGKSVSILSAAGNVWKQTWVDNQGGYLTFVAQTDGDKRIFATDPVIRNGVAAYQRMVFHDIAKDSFTWDWEGTRDGGKAWNNLWKIQYKRRVK